MQDNARRTLRYKERGGRRYWWYKRPGHDYTPPVFAFLDEEEWRLMDAWHTETDGKYVGECSVPPICFLLGLVMGNNIRRIAQLGHYAGFSALLMGFMARKMGNKNALYSVDIDAEVSAFTQHWVEKAGLGQYVNIVVADSAAEQNIPAARQYLGGPPQLVFIDSSHQYAHTVEELDAWYPALQPGGFILLHDISAFSRPYDATGKGGVNRAIVEWLHVNAPAAILINADHHGGGGQDLTYVDGCGLGLIQKPLVPQALQGFHRAASRSFSVKIAKLEQRGVAWYRRLRAFGGKVTRKIARKITRSGSR